MRYYGPYLRREFSRQPYTEERNLEAAPLAPAIHHGFDTSTITVEFDPVTAVTDCSR